MSILMLVLRALTTLAAVLVSISPLPDFWRVHKNRNTGEVSILPVVMLFCNCYMWTMYAILVGNIFPLFAVAIFGMLTSVVFGAIYYRWSKQRVYLHKLIFASLTVLVEQTLGFICVTINIALYASPLETMKKVIVTKNAASLPIAVSAIFLGNSMLWVAFAIADNDLFVLAPNALGAIFCSVQVVLYLIYRPVPAPKVQRVGSVADVKEELVKPTVEAHKCEEVSIQIVKGLANEALALQPPVSVSVLEPVITPVAAPIAAPV